MTTTIQQVQAYLEAKRAELQREIVGIIIDEASSGQPERGGEDRGEMAQTSQEVERDESLLQNQRQLLADVEEALVRLREGTYGRCISCGRPIPEQRLAAIPWAGRDIVCEERITS